MNKKDKVFNIKLKIQNIDKSIEDVLSELGKIPNNYVAVQVYFGFKFLNNKMNAILDFIETIK